MNNIEKINKFLKEDDGPMISLPKVNEEVVIFYQMLIQRLCKKNHILFQKIESYKNLVNIETHSLFEDKNTYLIDINSSKSAEEEIANTKKKDQKFFVFMNYASFKKNISKSIQINAYDFKKDISLLLNEDEGVKSWNKEYKIEFLNYCKNNPHLYFSEYEKSKIKIPHYLNNKGDDSDTILSIRKNIFKYKNDFSIKILAKLYALIKQEVKIKKFNF
ncbi:MAG: hypothetical protein O3C61_04690 [Proteobacteria bacterium]|nr:hypothetical protein [Pseudomonadota bacterium]